MASEQETKNLNTNNQTNSQIELEEASQDLSTIWHAIFLIVLILAILILVLLFVRQDPDRFKFWLSSEEKQVMLDDKPVNHNVFGDHFVNDLAIDLGVTNLHYDRTTTAFTFLPLYDWLDTSYCPDDYCGFDFSTEEYCLNERCLRVSGRRLFYQEQEQNLPPDLVGKNVLNVSIFPLQNDWLVGYVFLFEGAEQGKAYRFDGQRFTDLDPEGIVPFKTRAGFEGAKFGFGGDESNFLVMYGAYDMKAYQIVGDKLHDVSQFFGLRVSDGGFKPIAFRLSKRNDAVWYVCSTEASKPRLIKLWQNGTENIMGALSFTESILDRREGASEAWCLPGKNNDELDIVVLRGDQYRLKTLKDKGFNQAQNYILRTKNIFKGQGEIVKVTFNFLAGCGQRGCGDNMLDERVKFYFSGNGERFTPASINSEIIPPAGSTGLYWQLILDPKPSNLDYSPWVDGLLAISYAWQ